jgi:hypothetical protein
MVYFLCTTQAPYDRQCTARIHIITLRMIQQRVGRKYIYHQPRLSCDDDLRLHTCRTGTRSRSRTVTAVQPPPKLARRPTVRSILAPLFSAPRTPLPRASQGDRTDAAAASRAFRLRFVGGRSLRKRERFGRIAPRDEAAQRRTFARIAQSPRDIPHSSFSFSSTTRALGAQQGDRALSAPCDLLNGSGILVLVAMYLQGGPAPSALRLCRGVQGRCAAKRSGSGSRGWTSP